MGPSEAIPLFGMLTGIMTIGFMSWALVAIARGPIGVALSRRIAGRHGDGDLAEEVLALKEQVDQLQQQLVETQERLDFTERLLTSGRGARAGLPEGQG